MDLQQKPPKTKKEFIAQCLKCLVTPVEIGHHTVCSQYPLFIQLENGERRLIKIPVRNKACRECKSITDLDTLAESIEKEINKKKYEIQCPVCLDHKVNINEYYVDLAYERFLIEQREAHGNNIKPEYRVFVDNTELFPKFTLSTLYYEENTPLEASKQFDECEPLQEAKINVDDFVQCIKKEFKLKKSISQDKEIIKIDINPNLQKEVEDLVNKSFVVSKPKIRILSKPLVMDFAFVASYNINTKMSDKLVFYYPEMTDNMHRINQFLFTEAGKYNFMDGQGSTFVKIPYSSVWLIGGRNPSKIHEATNAVYEIEISKSNLQNGIVLTKKPNYIEVTNAAACYHEGSIYCSGGVFIRKDSTYEPCDTFKYIDVDPKTGTKWIDLPNLPEPRVFHSMIGLGNSIYVFGGLTCREPILSREMTQKLKSDQIILQYDMEYKLKTKGEWNKIKPVIRTSYQPILNRMLLVKINLDEILLIGGSESYTNYSARSYMSVYNSRSQEVYEKNKLNKDIVFMGDECGTTIFNNKLYAFEFKKDEIIHEYDLKDNKWNSIRLNV